MIRFVLLLGASAALGAENPVAWSITGKPAKPGASGTVRLTAKIEAGWRLYGFNQPEQGPRPTRIWLPDGQPFTLNGSIKVPATERKYDANFDAEIEYFKGDVMRFELPVKSTGSGPLRVSVRYQTCTDRLCLPPKTVTVEQ